MRGYFAIGVERISKQLNLGNLMRSAHGFGASFFFTLGAQYSALEGYSDTSRSTDHVPLYNWRGLDDMALPAGCSLVGIELMEDAVDLPSFRHPLRAAYVLGPERGSLSPELVARCDHIVKIPTAFCVNVAMAGAIVMYDRVTCLGGYPPRPMIPGGPVLPIVKLERGGPKSRTGQHPATGGPARMVRPSAGTSGSGPSPSAKPHRSGPDSDA